MSTPAAQERERCSAGASWPLYRIDAQARAERLGKLQALDGGGFGLETSQPRPALLHGDFAAGLPWFLDDLRPQGFLGRAFGRRVAPDLHAPADIALWNCDDIVLALLRHADAAPGDLVLGDDALQRAQDAAFDCAGGLAVAERERCYPELAQAVLRGEAVGPCVGGAQPKFALDLVRDAQVQPVIVKFSGRIDTPDGRRWADLLVCEHLAGEAMREHGLASAQSEIVAAGSRVFLQSTRFDRTSERGRRGLVSLAALDAAFYGHGRIDWWRFAPQLERDGWLDPHAASRLRRIGWFGALIANSDMHLGNVALQLQDTRPLPLAPVYDMLPMTFRPASNGGIVERRYRISLPAPEHRTDWQEAAPVALVFWQRVAIDPRISVAFRAIAADAIAALQRALAHVRG